MPRTLFVPVILRLKYYCILYTEDIENSCHMYDYEANGKFGLFGNFEMPSSSNDAKAVESCVTRFSTFFILIY